MTYMTSIDGGKCDVHVGFILSDQIQKTVMKS